MTHPLAKIHAGQPAVVLGGGPSLPESVAWAQANVPNAIWLSANEHGAMLRPVDYIVACDLNHQRLSRECGIPVRMIDALRPHAERHGAKLVSRREGGDFQVLIEDGYHPLNAGFMALRVAWLMGCTPIYAAGMDCFESGSYYHDAEAWTTGLNYRRGRYVEHAKEAAAFLVGADVRVLGGGPLAEAWP